MNWASIMISIWLICFVVGLLLIGFLMFSEEFNSVEICKENGSEYLVKNNQLYKMQKNVKQ